MRRTVLTNSLFSLSLSLSSTVHQLEVLEAPRKCPAQFGSVEFGNWQTENQNRNWGNETKPKKNLPGVMMGTD